MNTEQTHREYPFDTDNIGKGSVVTAAFVADAYGVKVGTQEHAFKMLDAARFIERRLGERGERVVVRQQRGDLHVLTDDAAIPYTAARFKSAISEAARAHVNGSKVDRSKVTSPELLKDHDRNQEVQGRMLAAARRERRALPPAPVQRSTPLLPERKP
jgi:DNA-binding transcriptional MocR family regulator